MQLNLNVTNLLLKGSSQFLKDMEVVYTFYEFGNYDYIKHRDIFEEAMLNSTFAANYPGDAEIMNQLYADIWNNETETDF